MKASQFSDAQKAFISKQGDEPHLGQVSRCKEVLVVPSTLMSM